MCKIRLANISSTYYDESAYCAMVKNQANDLSRLFEHVYFLMVSSHMADNALE